ncbi:MAG: hypothetical protein KDB27_04460 [Planctomycetales bacterium]|nr:hypothetical protein [Planctomycetales bacterium]
MDSDPTTTNRIEALKAGDSEAANALWHQYFGRLVDLARKKLGQVPKRVADEEDAALSVFRCVCDGASRGAFEKLDNREDLWQILAAITARKAIDQKRRLGSDKRGSGNVRGESVFYQPSADANQGGIQTFFSAGPSPDFLVSLAEEHQRMISMLNDEKLIRIATAKMEGSTNAEIAMQLDITVQGVERKLQRIRDNWSRELNE